MSIMHETNRWQVKSFFSSIFGLMKGKIQSTVSAC